MRPASTAMKLLDDACTKRKNQLLAHLFGYCLRTRHATGKWLLLAHQVGAPEVTGYRMPSINSVIHPRIALGQTRLTSKFYSNELALKT
jgi:hypothetical protein